MNIKRGLKDVAVLLAVFAIAAVFIGSLFMVACVLSELMPPLAAAALVVFIAFLLATFIEAATGCE